MGAKELANTKALIMKKIRQHLTKFRKHEKSCAKVSEQTLWFRPDRLPDKYIPVFEEKYHLEEIQWELEELVFDLIYNHELIDFKKLKRSNPLGIKYD